MPDLEQFIGIGAGICTGISLLPQLIKIIKERRAADLAWGTLFILLAGLGGWIWYGILKEDYPIIITNVFSFCVNVAIIVLSIRFPKSTGN